VDERDVELRNRTYARFVELGRAPAPEEVGPRDEVLAGWRRLHDAHALVLEEGGEAIRMANPFSAVPTPYRVEAAGRRWYANCGWDAFGICAALGVDGRFECFCPDCGEPIAVEVREGRPDDAGLVFHSLVPARRWWDDIVHT
jgi:hypothetical protein